MASLVKQLDRLVGDNSDQQFKAFVNLLGDDREELEEAATSFATKSGMKNVPIVVPVEFENGPRNYGVNPKAGITVLIYKRAAVQVNHAYDKLDEEAIKAILADVPKILN